MSDLDVVPVDMRLRPDIKEAWATALETRQVGETEVEQGFNSLRGETGGYCCLGVLGCVLVLQFPDVLEATGWNYDQEVGAFYRVNPVDDEPPWPGGESSTETVLPDDLAHYIGMRDGSGANPQDPEGGSLVELNDNGEHDFSAIAAVIRQDY